MSFTPPEKKLSAFAVTTSVAASAVIPILQNGDNYVATVADIISSVPVSGGGGSGTLGGDSDIDFTDAANGAYLGVNNVTFERRQRVYGALPSGNGGTLNVDFEPALPNSLLLAYLATGDDSGQIPSGWSEVCSSPSTDYAVGSYIFQKTAVGGETTVSVLVNNFNDGDAVMVVEEWTGAYAIGTTSGTNFAFGNCSAGAETLTLSDVPAGSVVVATQQNYGFGDQGAVSGWSNYYLASGGQVDINVYEQTVSSTGNVSFAFGTTGYGGSESNAMIAIYSKGNKPYAFSAPSPAVEQLSDVQIDAFTNGDVLTYSSMASAWVNSPIGAIRPVVVQSSGPVTGNSCTLNEAPTPGNIIFCLTGYHSGNLTPNGSYTLIASYDVSDEAVWLYAREVRENDTTSQSLGAASDDTGSIFVEVSGLTLEGLQYFTTNVGAGTGATGPTTPEPNYNSGIAFALFSNEYATGANSGAANGWVDLGLATNHHGIVGEYYLFNNLVTPPPVTTTATFTGENTVVMTVYLYAKHQGLAQDLKLESLADVSVNELANGQILTYSQALSGWTNTTLVTGAGIAAEAPILVQSNSAEFGSGTNSIAVTYSNPTTEGNLLLMFVAGFGGQEVYPPSGWDVLSRHESSLVFVDGSTQTGSPEIVYAFCTVATGAETTITATSYNTDGYNASIHEVSNWGPIQINLGENQNVNSNVKSNFSSIVPSMVNALALGAATSSTGGTSVTASAGWTVVASPGCTDNANHPLAVVSQTVSTFPSIVGGYIDFVGGDTNDDSQPWMPNILLVINPPTPVVNGTGGGSSSLADDSDVHLESPTNGQVLTYSTALSGWTNSAPGSGGGGAVNSVAGATGDVTFSSTDSSVTITVTGDNVNFEAAGGGSSTLASDTDVHLFSPTDGELLTYSTALSGWTNSSSISGGSATLAGLDDVDFSNAGPNSYLSLNNKPYAMLERQVGNNGTSFQPAILNFETQGEIGDLLVIYGYVSDAGGHSGNSFTGASCGVQQFTLEYNVASGFMVGTLILNQAGPISISIANTNFGYTTVIGERWQGASGVAEISANSSNVTDSISVPPGSQVIVMASLAEGGNSTVTPGWTGQYVTSPDSPANINIATQYVSGGGTVDYTFEALGTPYLSIIFYVVSTGNKTYAFNYPVDYFAENVDVNVATAATGKYLTYGRKALANVQRILVNSRQNGSNVNPLTVNFNNPPVSGNLLIAYISGSSNSFPTGWTNVASCTSTNGSATLQIWTKTSAGSSDQSITITPTTGCAMIFEEWQGAVFNTPIALNNSLLSPLIDFPNGSVAIAAYANGTGNVTASTPGWTQYFQYGGDNYNYGSGVEIGERYYPVGEYGQYEWTFNAYSPEAASLTFYLTQANHPYAFESPQVDLANLLDVNPSTARVNKYLTFSPITNVQRQSFNTTTSNPYSATLTNPPTSGNLLVAIMAGYSPVLPTGWIQQGTSSNSHAPITVFSKISAGSSDQTISINFTGGSTGNSIFIEEWEGAAFNCLPLTTTGVASTGTISVPANSIVCAAMGGYVGSAGTAETGWTQYFQYGGDNSNYGSFTVLAEKQVFAAESDQYTFTASSYGGFPEAANIIYYLSPSIPSYEFAAIKLEDNVADVFISGPTNGQVLTYSTALSGWTNSGSISGGYIGATNYDAVILSQSPSHYWPLNDVVGSSEAADLIGSQPLTPSGSPTFGAPPLALDGETSVWSSGSADSLTMPEACQPTGNFSVSFLCSIAALTGATAWSFGNSNGNFGIGVYSTSSPYVFAVLSNLINWYETNVAVSASKVHVCVTYNGTFLVYINGALALDNGSITCTPSTTTGQISGVPGRMAKAALWNGTVLTLAQILEQVAAAGL